MTPHNDITVVKANVRQRGPNRYERVRAPVTCHVMGHPGCDVSSTHL